MKLYQSGFLTLGILYIMMLLGTTSFMFVLKLTLFGLAPMLIHFVQEFPDKNRRQIQPPLYTAARLFELLGIAILVLYSGAVWLGLVLYAPLVLAAGIGLVGISSLAYLSQLHNYQPADIIAHISTLLMSICTVCLVLYLPFGKMAFLVVFPLFLAAHIVRHFVVKNTKKPPLPNTNSSDLPLKP